MGNGVWCGRGGVILKKYAVKRNKSDKVFAILNYDEDKKEYTIDIPDDISIKEAPFMLGLLMKKRVPAYWTGMEFQMGTMQGNSKQPAKYRRNLKKEWHEAIRRT